MYKSPIITCRCQPCLDAVPGVGVKTWNVGGSERRRFLQRYTGSGNFLKRASLEAIQVRLLIPALRDSIQSHSVITGEIDWFENVFLVSARQDCDKDVPRAISNSQGCSKRL